MQMLKMYKIKCAKNQKYSTETVLFHTHGEQDTVKWAVETFPLM